MRRVLEIVIWADLDDVPVVLLSFFVKRRAVLLSHSVSVPEGPDVCGRGHSVLSGHRYISQPEPGLPHLVGRGNNFLHELVA